MRRTPNHMLTTNSQAARSNQPEHVSANIVLPVVMVVFDTSEHLCDQLRTYRAASSGAACTIGAACRPRSQFCKRSMYR